ncbi:MAG: MotE family protein [Rhizobiaceae bacterium]
MSAFSPSTRRKPLMAIAATALVLAFAAPMPASTQAVPEQLEGMVNEDIRRFCTNIADAARDRRYSLQRMELETLQTDIESRIAALEAKRAEYESWLKRRDDFLDQAQGSLVDIYGRMRPDAAAERLAELRVDLAAAIVMKLDSRQASIILNEMDAKVAAALTAVIASASRTEDPA